MQAGSPNSLAIMAPDARSTNIFGLTDSRVGSRLGSLLSAVDGGAGYVGGTLTDMFGSVCGGAVI